MSRYCLDADTFIRAKNGEYAMDVHLGFWTWVDQQAAAEVLFSPMMVYGELTDGNDDLAVWAKDRRDSGLFIVPSEVVQENYRQIADHVRASYQPHHASAFLEGADAWVIAHAKPESAIVVTHEKFEPNALKVKIPNVCQKFGVEWKTIYKMLRELGAKF